MEIKKEVGLMEFSEHCQVNKSSVMKWSQQAHTQSHCSPFLRLKLRYLEIINTHIPHICIMWTWNVLHSSDLRFHHHSINHNMIERDVVAGLKTQRDKWKKNYTENTINREQILN